MNKLRTHPPLISKAFETSGVSVVNNGFGAGYAASLMNQLANK